MKKKYDVIVVGAGLSGAVAAYVLAGAGLEVIMFERGEYPGEKNMFGGVLYGGVLNEVIPGYWEEAPLERRITRKVITLLTREDALSMELDSRGLGHLPYSGFTVRRNLFDRWLAQKAEEAGALLVSRTVVDDVISKNGRVIGVLARRDEGEIYADVVIAADGANSLLARKAGLRKEYSPSSMNLGIKQVIHLPQSIIDERFNLTGNEGVANEFVGGLKDGVHGGGFLYTYKDSIAVGVVLQLPSVAQRRIKPYEVLDDFVSHPVVRRWIKGGTIREYSAHLIPEGGLSMVSRPYTDGLVVVGDAAGLTLVTGLNLEGANYAIASGVAAAMAIAEAAQKGDFSTKSLARYVEILKEKSVLKDMITFRNSPRFLQNPRLYEAYPEALCRLVESVFLVTDRPKKKLLALAREQLGEQVGTWQLLKDGLQAGRALLW